ncbi:anti-sigma factor [Parapedobacter defluvii]|uniref:Anti-sigma factor n=2 Tax=Parapedobacter defluvii TaxID=2045106 RepID=A0ABQ1KXF6_9SPHI|nr:anti-sigma factor [Parapedobacter defluvii]
MEVTPEMLQRYHEGLCSPEERDAVIAWLNETTPSATSHPSPAEDDDPDIGDRIWQRIQDNQGLQQHQSPKESVTTGPRSIKFKPIIRVAAIFLAVLSVGTLLLFLKKNKNPVDAPAAQITRTVEIPNGKKGQLTLPDGTVVYLNAGSTLRYPDRFPADSREVYLVGEAYFDVTADSKRPFRITTDQTVTEVLGTAFNLTAYPDEQQTVLVEQGSVRFASLHASKELVVHAGEGARYQTGGSLTSIDNIPTDRLAWKTNNLVFNNHRLADIAKRIQRWYGVTVEIKREELNTMTFTGSFDNAALKELMDDLSFVMQFRYQIINQHITIY